ncbi:neural cell adhesion molecule L1 isoform X3 [Hemicordylus capensis]|uniref:neural cell adhesion molecule L1 isoform X3 n=1 Tax=Hemicordylus capensis TaxID=884348 RepID=UPI00230353C5|nr:neural cell adhesion molecule L1 isoform X3 [Hemicordylus capensis]
MHCITHAVHFGLPGGWYLFFWPPVIHAPWKSTDHVGMHRRTEEQQYNHLGRSHKSYWALHAASSSVAVPLPRFGERPRPKVPGKMTPAHLLILWPLVLLLCHPAASIQLPPDLLQPPEFKEQPEAEIVVFPTDEVTLKCEATGKPKLTFRWTKDRQLFDPHQEPGVTMRDDSGTLVITTNNGNVATKFQGVYRCYASNDLGTAMSTEGRIVAESAPQWPKEKVASIEVEEQAAVSLPCNPPTSAVPPKIYWLNSKIEHITQNERVTMGQNGNLYFANVEMNDSQPDYICNAHFQGPRIIIQKEPIELKVHPSNSLQVQELGLMLPEGASSTYVALQGKTLVLECIVKGYPTPSLEWVNVNGLMPSGRTEFDNYNRTLRIHGVVEDDDGEYQCIAHNKHGTIRHKYYVTVEAAPSWRKKPESHIYGPGEEVRLDCEVYGKPKPKVSWRINGVPWNELQQDPKRTLNHQGSLIFSRVQPNDTAVIQCEAHNKHGRLLANAYMHVVRLPAQILTANGLHYNVVINQTASLNCKTFGAPRPKVRWFMDDMFPTLGEDRMFEHINGTLQIEQVELQDAGNYTCVAQNDQNNVSIIAHLVVKEATQVEVKPAYVEAKTGYSVTFHCMVQFDKSHKQETKWHRDGKDIEEPDDSDKYFINGTSLTITDLKYSDQGTYSCLASTDFDSVEKSAKLLVVGKPGPVTDLEVEKQQDWQVKLTWTPAEDHNSPIQKYIVYFEESFFEPDQWKRFTSVPGNQQWAQLDLSPFGKYRFKVQARNKHGDSDVKLSSTSKYYETSPAAPERNPSDVHGEGTEPRNMIISWTPLPRIDWNARTVKYHVQWRLKNQGQWNETEVEEPPVVVTDTPIFSPYEIKVQARNDHGKGPEPLIFTGYSWEDIPEAVPENLAVEVINNTTIKLSWFLSDKKKVWGRLKGFKVYYTRLGTVAEYKHQKSHPHAHHGDLLITGDVNEGTLEGFHPWSHYRVQMAVVNGRGEGNKSEPIDFDTPEGVPAKPESFHLDYLSDTALALEWLPPQSPNGVLLKYVLKYLQVNQTEVDNNGIIIPATQLAYNLTDLAPQIPYKFYLQAETREGMGEISFLEEHSVRESVNMSLMNISLGETGENYTTILWIPRPNQRDMEFAVHIMSKSDREDWRDVGKATSSQGSYSIPDLEPGKQYRVRLVKVHRTGDNQTIWQTDVETSGVVSERYRGFAKEGWFIGFVSAIVLLILVLVLLCFIKRSKGGKYSVKDKEDTQVDSEARPMKDETFGEYRSLESSSMLRISDNEEKPFTSSQPSLNGDIKALGSDDSLADYGGSVDVQFNEDGSFIGQYSGHKGKDGGGNDSSGATSPTNVATVLE